MSRIKDFQSAGANIIAVYPGPAQGLAEHAEDFVRGKTLPSNFYLVLDPDYSFTNMYGLRWDARMNRLSSHVFTGQKRDHPIREDQQYSRRPGRRRFRT
jgi:hypothetical protein